MTEKERQALILEHTQTIKKLKIRRMQDELEIQELTLILKNLKDAKMDNNQDLR